jgi:hypothetical protein
MRGKSILAAREGNHARNPASIKPFSRAIQNSPQRAIATGWTALVNRFRLDPTATLFIERLV